MSKLKKININKTLQKAISAHKSNSFKKAERLYKQILETAPNHPDANHGFGILCAQFKQLELAIKLFEKAVHLNPKNLQFQQSLAKAKSQYNQLPVNHQISMDQKLSTLFNNNKYSEAIQLAQESVKNNSNYAFGWKIIGSIELTQEEYENSIIHLQKALSINPIDPEAHNNLALAFKNTHKLEDAEKGFREAIKLNPNFVLSYNNLGLTLKDLKKQEEAEIVFNKAIQINPNYAEAHSNLGIVLQELEKFSEAETSYQKAIQLNSNNALFHYNLANLFTKQKRTKEAISSFKEAIKLNPKYINPYYNLSNVLIDIGDTKEGEKTLLKLISINPNYTKAHKLLSTVLKYSEETSHLKQLHDLYRNADNLHDTYHLGFALAKAYEDIKDYDKSFSYLEKANNAKDKESNYNIKNIKNDIKHIQDFFTENKLKNSMNANHENNKQAIFILGMPRSGTTLTEQILSSHSLVYGCGELEYIYQLFSKENSYTTNSLNNTCTTLYKDYIKRLKNIAFKENIFTDKMPHNFIYIGFILETFPNAKVIHTKRNAMAICWSMYKQYFPASELDYCYNFDTLAEFYSIYNNIMQFWNTLYPGKIYNLQYETLTENQEEETKKLLEFCNLPWEDTVLEPHKNKRTILTASSQQVRKKVYKGSSEAWKKYERHLEALQNKLLSLGIEF